MSNTVRWRGALGIWVLLLALGLCTAPVSAAATYVGSAVCSGCHPSTHTSWQSTLHSSIYQAVNDSTILPTWSGVISVEATVDGTPTAIWADLEDHGGSGPFEVTLYADAALTQLIAGPMTIARVHGGRSIAENGNNSPRNTPGSVRGLRSNNENPIMPGEPDYYPGEATYIGKQRYQVMIGEQHYILPIQWNPIADLDRNNGGWVAYNLGDWIDASHNLVLTSAKSEERRCAGCHQTGIVDVTYNASANATVPGTSHSITGAYELVGNPTVEPNITCEACHGPGSAHIAGGFLGQPGSREIIQPALNLTVDQRVDACGFCHSRGHSVGTVNGMTLDYPFRDTEPRRPIPGDVWGDFYVEAGGYWIDTAEVRVARQHHQQYEEFVLSNHFNFPFHRVVCSDCHDSHGTSNEHDLVTAVDNSVSGEVAVTGARGVGEGNLCVGCHYSHGPFNNTLEDVDFERHYWHPPDGTHGSPDCTNCHMPAMATSAVGYDIHSHSFHVVEPRETITSQLPNSCMVMCHTGPYSTSYIPGGGPVNTSLLDWSQSVDVEIAEWLEEVAPNSAAAVASYLVASPEYVELVGESPYMAPALDANADTETLTGTDASPFVIDAADVVSIVNE